MVIKLTEKKSVDAEVNDQMSITLESNVAKVIRKKYKYFAGVTAILLCSTLVSLLWYTSDNKEVAKGVMLYDTTLEGLTLAEAQEKANQAKDSLLKKKINLTLSNYNIDICLEDLGLGLEFQPTIGEAYEFDKQGGILTRLTNKLSMRKGMYIEPIYTWDNELLTSTLNTRLADLNKPVENAKFIVNYTNNTLNIISEKQGTQVDIDQLIKIITKSNPKDLGVIQIPLEIINPEITKANLESQGVTGKISSYTTKYNPSEVNRTENLRLAIKAIDGTLLKPGDTFSFNDIVGERTARAGYKDAFIIVNSKFVQGLGGGICQVSSTLYNAVRQADLSVVERTSHSLPVTYVPSGFDATVAYGSLDFRFKNNTNNYILIRGSLANGIVTFNLYGKV